MKTLFALVAVGILLFGCAALGGSSTSSNPPEGSPPSGQQEAPEQQPVPPPAQKTKTATPQQPETNEPETQPEPENISIKEQPPAEEQEPQGQQPPSAADLLSNPSLAGSPHPKVKEPNTPPCCNHPYYHKIYRAFSSDAVSWQKEGALIKDHASVPAILQKDDGSFIVYYVDGEYDTVDCIVSQDGKTFSPGDCTIYGFAGWKAYDPYVVKLENGYYRMFFYAPTMDLMGDSRIMSATSKDGISWLQDAGVRFSHPQIYDPPVINTGSGWWMFAGYNPASSPGSFPEPKIVSATSSDGITFAKEAVLDFGGNVPEIVKLDDGRYALYYCGMGGIAMSTSSEGVSWSSGTTALSSDPGKITCDPSIIKMKDGRWVMYYKVQEARMQ